ncbi:MAG: S-adenosylmethionine:tRNA ribosyltransferase-isomerase [Chitinophagales bacterium]|nr:S-adenosylmethionine:tRNA ribosyltransferase-isomerase [Chitinophagales bacterium]
MQHPSSLKIEDYTYDLPDDRIAAYPLQERDASKLLIYSSGNIEEDVYRNIANHIPENSLLVFNQTKVVNARLLFKKDTGGLIEIFCLEPHSQYPEIQTALLQKNKVWWNCMVGGASKWKQGMLLSVQHTAPDFTLQAAIVERQSGSFTIEFTWDADLTFAEVLHYIGKVPIPPYLHRESEKSDEQRYQTIYAKEEGSVAAPTAGLHFTDTVFKSFETKHIDKAFVTLHVGAGTFKPVKSETMDGHDMHTEWIEIEASAIEKLLQHAGNIIAVGTTSMRTLESLYWIGAKLLMGIKPEGDVAITQWEPYELKTEATVTEALQAIADYLVANNMQRLVTRTQILIAPGYKCRVINGLVTNFHQPQSTLLLLVAAITNNNWRTIYNHALNNDYRFLSYGDGSLIWAD